MFARPWQSKILSLRKFNFNFLFAKKIQQYEGYVVFRELQIEKLKTTHNFDQWWIKIHRDASQNSLKNGVRVGHSDNVGRIHVACVGKIHNCQNIKEWERVVLVHFIYYVLISFLFYYNEMTCYTVVSTKWFLGLWFIHTRDFSVTLLIKTLSFEEARGLKVKGCLGFRFGLCINTFLAHL